MTGIINIIFPGILELLCPTGMSCLPRFQPRLKSLHELWDLDFLVFHLPHTRFYSMPVRVTGPSVLNLTAPWTLSRVNTMNPHESRSLCLQGSASVSTCSQKPQVWGLLCLPLLDCTQLSPWKIPPWLPELLPAAHCPSQTRCWVLLPWIVQGSCTRAAPQEPSSRNFPCLSPIICIPRAGQSEKVNALAEEQPRLLLLPVLSSHPLRPWRL